MNFQLYCIVFLIIILIYGEYLRMRTKKVIEKTMTVTKTEMEKDLSNRLQSILLMMGLPIELQNKKEGGDIK